MENLWTRRSNSGKLSLSTNPATTNGAHTTGDGPGRGFSLGKRQDATHQSRTSLGAMSPGGLTSPTAGASSAFGLGSGAFASFGAAKAPRTPGSGGLHEVGGGAGTRTPTTEKQLKDLDARTSKVENGEAKAAAAQPAKHCLKHSWVFWFRPPQPKNTGYVEYDKSIHPMATVDTAEDFFTFHRYLRRPSSLPLVSDYHMFKKGIRPIWEDDDNRKGGKWIVRLKKGVADRYWEDLMLALIGDQFAEASEDVCGAVLSVRNGEDILSIWARNDGGRVLRIRETMKRVLSLPPDTKLEWKSHDSSIQQRTALDDARKEKSASNGGTGHSHTNSHHTARTASREDDNLGSIGKK